MQPLKSFSTLPFEREKEMLGFGLIFTLGVHGDDKMSFMDLILRSLKPQNGVHCAFVKAILQAWPSGGGETRRDRENLPFLSSLVLCVRSIISLGKYSSAPSEAIRGCWGFVGWLCFCCPLRLIQQLLCNSVPPPRSLLK